MTTTKLSGFFEPFPFTFHVTSHQYYKSEKSLRARWTSFVDGPKPLLLSLSTFLEFPSALPAAFFPATF